MVGSCQGSKKEWIERKNRCYSEQLNDIKDSYHYRKIHNQFLDTFEVLRRDKENFGVAEYVETRVDSAVFFNNDSTMCMLLVLKKLRDSSYSSEGAVVIYGTLVGSGWRFEVGSSLSFDPDYLESYERKNFEAISKVSRYTIMATGQVKRDGCEIDKNFWFTTEQRK